MNIQKEKNIINKICAMLIIVALTLSDFLFIGEATVSYAVDTIRTNSSNVDFSAYFLNENGEKVEKIEETMQGDRSLYVDVTVKNEGYFNGKIRLNNSGFNIKNEIHSSDIASISENTVTLNQINAGSTVTVKLDIEAKKDNIINTDTLMGQTEVILEGQYVDGKRAEKTKYTEVKGTSKVEIDWKSNENSNAELSSNILTNNIYKVDGEEKRIVQVLVDSKVTDNNYPIKQTEIGLTMPKKAESVSVYARSTSATNSNIRFGEKNYTYNEENNELSITVLNEDKNNISWNKNGADTFVVTYIFNKEESVLNDTISVNSQILMYDNKELTTNKDVQIKEEIDGIVSYSMKNEEKTIYKGKIYTGEERVYNTISKININYLNIANNIILKGNDTIYYTESNESKANIVYKETKINKHEFLKLFGEDGYITIKDSNGTIVANINKDSEENENGDIVTTYSEGITNLEITTSSPISLGTLNIKNTKAIMGEGYSRGIINDLKGIRESISGYYNDKASTVSSSDIELKNTSSEALLNVSTDTLSTVGTNEKVKIKAVLLNNDESKDLYKNPTIKIILPKQVTNINAKCKMLYGNGLELNSANIYKEDGRNIIEVKLQGEQTKYNTETLEGTTLVIYADIDLDSLAVNSDEKITLNYTNDLATVFNDNGVQESNVKIMANTGVITTNNIEAYNVKTIGNQGTEKVSIDVGAEEKNATVNISAINNEGSKINDVKILGTFPTGIEDDLGVKLTSGISVLSSKNVQVYYSNEENPTTDIEDTTNGWTTTGSAESAKSYLIVGESMEVGEKIEASYDVNIPANLIYNLEAEEGYKVTYKNESTDMEKTSDATTISLSTGVGPEISTDLKAYVGGDEIKDQEEVNPGEVIKYQITIENTGNATASDVNLEAIIPENAKYVQYQKVSNIITADEDEQTDEEDEDVGNELLVIDDDDSNIEEKDIKDMTEEDMGFIEEGDPSSDTDTDENLGTGPDYYKEAEIEGGKISKKIDNLNPGEKLVVTYEIKVNENITENSNITTTINTVYNGITDTKSITNKVGKSQLSLNLYMIQRPEKTLNVGQSYIYVLEVKNLTDEKISKINVEMKTNEQFTIKSAEVYGGEEENEFELSNNTFTISNLEKSETAKYMFYVNPVKNGGDKATIYAIANNKYHSNQISEDIQEAKISMYLESESAGQSVKAGDNITYNIKVTNEGDIAVQTLDIEQQISVCLDVEDIKVDGETVEYSQNNGAEDLANSYTVKLNKPLEKGQSTNINVLTTLDSELLVTEDTQIVSLAKAYDEVLLAQTDEVNHVLLSSLNKTPSEQGQNPEDDEIEENSGNDTDNANNNGSSSNSNSGSNAQEGNQATDNQIHTVSGIAWLDKNENGQRDSGEDVLSGIQVRLVDTQNNTIATGTTSENGFYSLTNVPNGQYIATFEYDTDKYILTSYQAEGINNNKNSDVESVNMNIDGNLSKVAATDTLRIDGNDLTNIDLGLVEAKTFDLELTKTISKVTVSSKEGTQNLEYSDSTLAKAEVKAKYLQGATVVAEYKIKVTNNGEVAGYVKNIVDYKPTDLNFNSSLNPDWYQSGDYVYSTSLANTKLEAGETKELTLVLTKAMTESNTGLVNNTAEIAEAYNNLNVQDTDSTPGNRKAKEDDMGSADLIISVKTGAMVSYVVITLSIIAAIAAGAYMISKKILKDSIKI